MSVYNQPPRSTQPFIPPKMVNRVPACLAGVKFSCVTWQVTLCYPIWQVTLRSSDTGSHEELHIPFNDFDPLTFLLVPFFDPLHRVLKSCNIFVGFQECQSRSRWIISTRPISIVWSYRHAQWAWRKAGLC